MKEVRIHLNDKEYEDLQEITVIVNYLTKEHGNPIHIGIIARHAIIEFIRFHNRMKNENPNDSVKVITNRLAYILRKRKIKKNEFAKEIEITSATLSNILTGKSEPTLDVAMRIADRLGLKITDIFFRHSS